MTDLPPALHDAMVHRAHEAEGCLSRVWYSRCDRYRYGLSRLWDATRPTVLFLMLNPSTADEHRNDPTVARCETRARAMGFGAVMIANIFAFRATRPVDLKRAETPIGELNDAVLGHWTTGAGMTVAAWGVHGGHQDRGRDVARNIGGGLHHLGLTKDGHPRHPLYVSFDTAPMEWAIADRYPLQEPVEL
jgi:hypothetical protein